MYVDKGQSLTWLLTVTDKKSRWLISSLIKLNIRYVDRLPSDISFLSDVSYMFRLRSALYIFSYFLLFYFSVSLFAFFFLFFSSGPSGLSLVFYFKLVYLIPSFPSTLFSFSYSLSRCLFHSFLFDISRSLPLFLPPSHTLCHPNS